MDRPISAPIDLSINKDAVKDLTRDPQGLPGHHQMSQYFRKACRKTFPSTDMLNRAEKF